MGPLMELQDYRAQTREHDSPVVSLTLPSSIIFVVRNPYLKAALALLGIMLAAWMYRIPSRDRPGRWMARRE